MDILLFEHPLDELTRLNLRLEFLFNQFNHHIQHDSIYHERASLEALVSIAHVLDRPDLKSKYVREFSVHIQQLTALLDHEALNKSELKNILEQLKEHMEHFSTTGKLGLNLRENFFLNTLRQHLAYPGGEADFEMPAYHLWLHNTRQEKRILIDSWFKEFSQIKACVTLLLKLTRNKIRSKKVTAIGGFYHEPLDSKNTAKLIQIKLRKAEQAYPSISAGKHRINIRFNEGGQLSSEEQAHRDVHFELNLCF